MLPSKDFVLVGTVASAVLAILLVALNTSSRRCRHPALRVIVWGASTAFLPLTSSIISALLLRRKTDQEKNIELKSGKESADVQNMWTLLLWTLLIVIIKGNADTAAASAAAASVSPSSGDESVDGQKVRTPVELLFKFAWLGYLIVLCNPEAEWLGRWRIAFFLLFALGFAKVALKLGAFFLAIRAYAVGKNARLVAGYMAQLVEDGEEEGHGQVPPYIVMGESKEHVEESPEGYRIKHAAREDKSSALVTLDRVWRLSADHGHGDGLLAKRRELRDLCLSFSLFKTLRRRLSGYPLAEEGSNTALDFVLRGMDTAGAGKGDADRVFRVLVDELWFASDFYYSPLPLCSFSGWCAVLNYLFSVLIVVGAIIVGWVYFIKEVVVLKGDQGEWYKPTYFVITYSLLLAVVLTETWEIITGVCSNWTKIALLGHYIRREQLWRRSRCAHATLGAVLRFRSARRWSKKIGQNSVLEPRRFGRRSGFFSEKLYGRAGLMRSVEVSPAVKEAVLRSLKSSYGGMNRRSTAARRVGLGGKVDWTWPAASSQESLAQDGDGSNSTTEHILACHIGTRLFEMKYSRAAAPTSAVADMTAACLLSYYCAYLVAAAPELLPDSAAWTDKRYKDVMEDVQASLVGKDDDGASDSTAQRYERLLKELSASTREKVLRRGAEHGRRLVEAYVEEEAAAAAWRFLADFWSEMVLFVAPSKNVKGHVEAMGRGGEFVTLVWALLLHAGVTDRPETPGSSIP